MHRLEYHIEGDKIIVILDASKAAIDEAPPSQSGRSRVVASTGSPVSIPSEHCSDLRLQLNLTARG